MIVQRQRTPLPVIGMRFALRRLSLAILALSLAIDTTVPLVAETASPPGTQDEIEKSFQVRPGGLLRIESDVANVEIATGDSKTVRVELRRRFEVRAPLEAEALRKNVAVDMTQSENDVNIVVKITGGDNEVIRRKVRLDFRIALPREFNLDLQTAGSAIVENLNGAVTASTRGGSLKLGNIRDSVKAKSEGGSLTIGDVAGDLEARSYGGSTRIGRVNGRVAAIAEGGSLLIEEAAEIVEATANGGSVAAVVSKAPRSGSKITANAGNIDLKLPASAPVSIDAACSAGRITSDFDTRTLAHADPGHLKGDINGGGPTLILRASAGNIGLWKGGK